jgi:transcriptional regulator with XRE-family HTH domain
MQDPQQYLAQVLRQLRQQQGWSLDRAARETGVSKAMLGQIERGESSPTMATLWKIAGGFQRSISVFIEPTPVENRGTILRSSDELRQQPADDEMLVATLFPFDKRFGFEMFELTLPSGYERLSAAHEPGTTEHLVVLTGAMEVLENGEWLALKKGDALRFAADRDHGYRNQSAEDVVFHNLISYSAR